MEILNTYTDMTWLAWLSGVPGTFGTMACIGFFLYFATNKKFKNAAIVFLIGVICVFSFKYVYMPYYSSPAGHYTYLEVILEEGHVVDPKEYRVVEKKGKITVLEQLNDEKLK